MGPFFLIDMLGLDTVLHVAEYLNESYGDGFYVHKGMQKLVADGHLGAKSGGDGFYKDGEPQIEGEGEPDAEELADLFVLKSLVEACKLLEEGVSTVREIDLGMMAGAGLDPRRGLFPPFWKADLEGLDVMLEKLERYEESHGERFAPPRTLKRLVAQGRLGLKSGQGFYAYPQVEGDGAVKLEKRGGVAIAWLSNPPMNAISPQVIQDLGKVWEEVKADDDLKAMVVYSSLPVVFSAGADIKAFTSMDEAGGAELIDSGHALLRELGQNRKSTVAAVNAIAFGGGCELAMACDFRVAAESAVFGQPEINLGIIPGFGGTQRLPRLVGASKALEMNLTGDAILAPEASRWGLADALVPDEELFDTASPGARKLAGQAPLAVEQIKQVSHRGDLDEGIEAEKQGFATAFLSEDAQGGHLRLPAEAARQVAGQVATDQAERLAELIRESECTVALTGAGDLGALGDPRLPHAGHGASGRRSTRWRSPTSTPSSAIRPASGASTGSACRCWATRSPTAPTRSLAELERRGLLEAVITQNIDTPSWQGRLGRG